jgi:ribonucleoside-diphosphate reductase alpha chain
MMFEKDDPSPFIDPTAVEVWDTWFRWREDGQLRDISIEATWERVARALARAEAAPSPRWVNRVIDAQSRWQIVFDERILSGAGTRNFTWPSNPVAVLNLATFVNAPLSMHARLDFESLRAAAELAVESLDNALLAGTDPDNAFANLRVGVIGLADALALLGKRYDSPAGRVLAGRMAQTLAEGALRANVRLAHDRGALADRGAMAIERARSRGMAHDLVDAAERTGLRHACVTAITSQRRLAKLANDVTDALDPLECGEPQRLNANVHAKRFGGFVQTVARRLGTLPRAAAGAIDDRQPSSLAAQITLRGAVQPWIDAPIDYPFRVEHAPDPQATIRWKQLAAANRLGDLTLAVNS